MTTQTQRQPNTETALQAWEPKEAKQLLATYPEQSYNLLVPTMSIRQVNPYLVPDIELVQLSVDESKGDIYHDSQMREGQYAPTAKGLAKIRQVAGIDEIESRRTDDGSDPDVVEWTVVIEMVLPSGRAIRGHGSKRIDLHQLSQQKDRNGKTWSPARLAKSREHLIANAQTKALNRAIRSMLSLHGSMPKAQFAKPFAVLRWVPNMSDPDVRRRMLDNLLPATTTAYGPEPRQIGAGEDVIHAEEAPEDDEAEDGQYVDVATNGHATVERSTGEVVAETPAQATDEPDWFGDPQAPDLATRLQQVVEAHASATGPADDDQRKAIKEALQGIKPAEAGIVLAVLWDLPKLADIQKRHARAIIEVGASLGHEELRRQWRALAAELDKASA